MIRMNDLIRKKRDGLALGADEIRDMIASYTCGDIPDYQMSAMMMAIYFNGMNRDETLALTLAMRDSGDTLDLSGISGIKVDKHSTGGVGDKTSIALAPLVAAAGAKVAKMSGRGLGHTGGTIDKLECFPGFSTELSEKAFTDQVNKTGLAIMGQTKDLAPADKKLYALRDVTATVEQISLIASSVMSKKLACGADGIVLDVKCGSGAFMKDISSARALAREMTEIGKGAGKKMRALITDMDEPLGYAVGNILEVKEAIETLKGRGPEDFTKLCLLLGSRMLMLSGICDDEDKASELLMKKIEDGSALEKLADFVNAIPANEQVYHKAEDGHGDNRFELPLQVLHHGHAHPFHRNEMADEEKHDERNVRQHPVDRFFLDGFAEGDRAYELFDQDADDKAYPHAHGLRPAGEHRDRFAEAVAERRNERDHEIIDRK